MELEAMPNVEIGTEALESQAQPILKSKLGSAHYSNLFKIANILLFDDDPIFLKIVKRFADKRHVPLTSVGTYEQFKKQWSQKAPDLVILDYDLDSELIGTHIARLLGDTPVIIISRKTRKIAEERQWSQNIRSFFHKKYGIPRLMSEVQAILGVNPHRDLLVHDHGHAFGHNSVTKRRAA